MSKIPMFILLLVHFCYICQRNVATAASLDYYWRDYRGKIPEDAISGGLDKNNHTTYIGQAFMFNNGFIPNLHQSIQPVTIYEGSKTVTASRWGVHTLSKFIKILCGPKPENFEWINAKADNLESVTVGLHLIEGGAEEGKILNIGRTQYQGELIVGKVLSYDIGNAKMHFPYEKDEKTARSYQVLVYKENVPDFDIRAFID